MLVIKGLRSALENRQYEAIPAVLLTAAGEKALTLSLAAMTDDERDIILAGCLINYYGKK